MMILFALYNSNNEYSLIKNDLFIIIARKKACIFPSSSKTVRRYTKGNIFIITNIYINIVKLSGVIYE